VHFEVQDATQLSLPSAPYDSVFDSGLLHSLRRRGGGEVDDDLALLPGLAVPGATVFVLAVSLEAGQGLGRDRGISAGGLSRAAVGRHAGREDRRGRADRWPGASTARLPAPHGPSLRHPARSARMSRAGHGCNGSSTAAAACAGARSSTSRPTGPAANARSGHRPGRTTGADPVAAPSPMAPAMTRYGIANSANTTRGPEGARSA
jgi:hypothetical protein